MVHFFYRSTESGSDDEVKHEKNGRYDNFRFFSALGLADEWISNILGMFYSPISDITPPSVCFPCSYAGL